MYTFVRCRIIFYSLTKEWIYLQSICNELCSTIPQTHIFHTCLLYIRIVCLFTFAWTIFTFKSNQPSGCNAEIVSSSHKRKKNATIQVRNLWQGQIAIRIYGNVYNFHATPCHINVNDCRLTYRFWNFLANPFSVAFQRFALVYRDR